METPLLGLNLLQVEYRRKNFRASVTNKTGHNLKTELLIRYLSAIKTKVVDNFTL